MREMPRYLEFAVSSNFSFLRGASHPEELMLQAAHIGLDGIGLCDRNSVAGVVRAHLIKREKELTLRYHPGTRLVFAHVAEAGQLVFGQLSVDESPRLGIADAVLEQRIGDAHDDRPVNLAGGQLRVHHQANVLHRHEFPHLDDAGLLCLAGCRRCKAIFCWFSMRTCPLSAIRGTRGFLKKAGSSRPLPRATSRCFNCWKNGNKTA